VIVASDISGSYYNDQRGNYSVFLRAKTSSSSIVWARIGFGYLNFSHPDPCIDFPTYRDRVEISSADWKLYPMGTISIPADHNSGSLYNAGIQIESQRLSGIGSLEMDCFILIPIDDGALTTKFTATVSAPDYGIRIKKLPMEDLYGNIYDEPVDWIIAQASTEETEWALPADNESPALVLAGQASTSVLTDTADITYTYIPRWRTLRGAAAP